MRTNPAAKITPDAASNGIRSACGTNSAARTGMKEHAMTMTHRSVFGDAVGPRLIFSGIIRLRPPRDTVSRSSSVVVSYCWETRWRAAVDSDALRYVRARRSSGVVRFAVAARGAWGAARYRRDRRAGNGNATRPGE